MATESQKRRKRNKERREAQRAEAMRPRTEEEIRAIHEKMARSWYERFSYRSRGHAGKLEFEFSGIPVPYDEENPSKGLVERTEETLATMSKVKH